MPIEVCAANSAAFTLSEQLRRRNRLTAILANGLPPFEHSVLELNAILNNPDTDIKTAARPIRTDPSLSVQVLRMCNSPLFCRRSRVISLEQATMLLGADRLRALAVTISLVGFAGQGLPKDQVAGFWRHTCFAAMLSRHLAQVTGYAEVEQAYIAGLLHDIGQVPQWMLISEEKAEPQAAPPDDWSDNPPVQRRYFGIDHCELGSNMIKLWELMPSFADVLLKHHEPLEAQHDPCLVGIVAGAEHFLLAREELARSPGKPAQSPGQPWPSSIPAYTDRTRQPFSAGDWLNISQGIENEYERLLPLVEGTMASILGNSS